MAAENSHSFVERVKASKKEKRIDNSSLYAGSPMYYYCYDCGVFITSLSEGHSGRAPSRCSGCERLEKEALLDVAKKRAK
jgi:hypothetical protein